MFARKGRRGSDFGIWAGRSYKAGESILRGHVDTRRPGLRGQDVLQLCQAGSRKCLRLQDHRYQWEWNSSRHRIPALHQAPAGRAARRIRRIDAPNLYINGKLANLPVFQRVMSAKDGYRGYSNMPGQADYFTTP